MGECNVRVVDSWGFYRIVSPRKTRPTRTNPDRGEPKKEIGNDRTTPRDLKEPKTDWALPKHKANSMAVNTLKPNDVCYVDSGASNHMTSHEEWFSYSEKPKQPK